MSFSSPVSLHPYFRVHEGRLAEAELLLPQFVQATSSESKVVYYEFSLNENEVFCREAYADAEGVLAHLANVDSLLKQMLTVADLTRLEVHGPSEEIAKLREPLAGLKPAFFEVVCSLER